MKCGRAWSEKLEADEVARGLQPGQQYDPIVERKTRKSSLKPKVPKYVPFGDDLPPQFAGWQIGESDEETEIYNKRSLMRLDSRKIYNQMGLSTRAHDSAKAALLWVSKLWEHLEPEEQQELAPTLERLKDVFAMLNLVRRSKIGQAVKMEKAMEQAYQQARIARSKAAAKLAKAREKDASKLPEAGQDSEGLGLTPVAIDPSQLFEQAREKLLKLDKTKGKKGRSQKPKDEEDAPDAE